MLWMAPEKQYCVPSWDCEYCEEVVQCCYTDNWSKWSILLFIMVMIVLRCY